MTMPTTDRRSFLKSGAALPLAGLLRVSRGEGEVQGAPPQSLPPLKESAGGAGLLYGAALFPQDLENAALLRLYAQQCSLVVGTAYMDRVEAARDRFDFSACDAVMRWGTANGMKLRGHPLVYGKATPEWVHSLGKSEAGQALEGYIRNVAGRYRGQMFSWDVVNEAIDPAAANGYRDSPWLRLIGPEYIERSFYLAREADSTALLSYNDFGLEPDGVEHERKREAVYGLLRTLTKRNAPIGALGIQSHIGARFQGGQIRTFLKKVSDLGLKIVISELDVRDNPLPAAVPQRDDAVAHGYENYLDTVLPNPATVAVITWGLYDGDTWLDKSQPRQDGLPQRSLPFDNRLQPKPAAYAMERSFSRRQQRRPGAG